MGIPIPEKTFFILEQSLDCQQMYYDDLHMD